MSTSSEAVMVSPEQCATAPKSALTKGFAPSDAPKSSTRVVLLSVLALAAATGAMFGVVVFGNEFTKDVHPKGSSNMNSVTLVDTNDRAIATADVESYVSLLDLPLLGTAELNKIDGITFSTAGGVEHRKITGYTVSKETTVVGDSVATTPRLSLRSEPGVTIEVSVRDASAWVLEIDASSKSSTVTSIETAHRRLSDGAGSCLGNGACLYSRDELLRIDAETRQLSEGSFFARADVAAYQVDLNGEDVMQYLGASDESTRFLDGTFTQDGHAMRLRFLQDGHAHMYVENMTDGSAKLMTINGTFTFNKNGDLVSCSRPKPKTRSSLDAFTIEEIKRTVDFDKLVVTTDTTTLPQFQLSQDACVAFQTRMSNMSSPEVAAQFSSESFSGNSARKLAEQTVNKRFSFEERRAMHQAEMHALMSDANNELNQQWAHAMKTLDRRRLAEERELGGAGSGNFYYTYGGSGSGSSMDDGEAAEAILEDMVFRPYTGSLVAGESFITHFDLWLATRLADPTFLYEGNKKFNSIEPIQMILGVGSESDISTGGYMGANFALDMSGAKGISRQFKRWANLLPVDRAFLPPSILTDLVTAKDTAATVTGTSYAPLTTANLNDLSISLSKTFFHTMFPGSCSGGYFTTEGGIVSAMIEYAGQLGLNRGMDVGLGDAMCGAMTTAAEEGMSETESTAAKAEGSTEKSAVYKMFLEVAVEEAVEDIEDECKMYRRRRLKGAPPEEKSAEELACDAFDTLLEDEESKYMTECGYEVDSKGGIKEKEVSKRMLGEQPGKLRRTRGRSLKMEYGCMEFEMELEEKMEKEKEVMDGPPPGKGRFRRMLGERAIHRRLQADARSYSFSASSFASQANSDRNSLPSSLATLIEGASHMAVVLDNFCVDFLASHPALYNSLELDDANSWASYLVKDLVGYDGVTLTEPEYIAVFQGTKATDMSMVQYNLDIEPVFAFLNANSATIMPGGYYRYMSSLLSCMDDMIASPFDGVSDSVPTFITGHSLGGAAATLYAQSKAAWLEQGDDVPRLVTFGAAPTAYNGPSPTDGVAKPLIECKATVVGQTVTTGIRRLDTMSADTMSMYCTTEGFLTATGMSFVLGDRGVGAVCTEAPPLSVRFYHKFDPIPSIAMWGGQYAHSVQFPIMLVDYSVDTCASETGCLISSAAIDASADDVDYWSYRLRGTNPFLVTDYLCSESSVQAAAMPTTCESGISSYMTMLNPWPCGLIPVMKYWQNHDNLMTPSYSIKNLLLEFDDLKHTLLVVYEDYMDCVGDWYETFETYWLRAVIEMPYSAGLAFTFTYVHAVYGLYPLCVTLDPETGSPVSQGNAGGETIDMPTCTNAEIENCYDVCEAEASGDPSCVSCCIWNDCAPCLGS